MRTMLILIKREIVDHVGYFIAAGLVASLLALGTAAALKNFDMIEGFGLILVNLTVVGMVGVLGLCALGVAQMHVDRNRNISAFLMALPVTRFQLFAARVLAGGFAAAILVIPLAVTSVLTIHMQADEVPVFRGFIGDVFWGLFLVCLACYSLGLLAGWNRRSLAPTLAVFPLVLLVPTVVMIKGFDQGLLAVLCVLTLACLAVAWGRFSASSL